MSPPLSAKLFLDCGLLLCMIVGATTKSAIVQNGAYHNVVVEIQRDVPHDDCVNFLSNLENALMSSSKSLYNALDRRIYYASFDIIVPSTWPNHCINGTIMSSNGDASDITVTMTHPIFGDNLWTQQSRQCSEPGEQIFVSYNAIQEQQYINISSDMVREWTKYRYGVFDEMGFENDQIYPECDLDNAPPVCHDALNAFSAAGYNEPYGNGSAFHNRYMPTKHNHICHRQSPSDVINKHPDFIGSVQVGFRDAIFTYTRRSMTRYIVIIDNVKTMDARNIYKFMRDSIRKFLESDLSQDLTEVGIMMMHNYNKTIEQERQLIRSLRSPNDRAEIYSAIPWYNEYKWSNQNNCPLMTSIAKSASLLQDRTTSSGAANNVILIIAPGMQKCDDELVEKTLLMVNEASIKIATINYPTIESNRKPLDALASSTNGASFTVVERKHNEERSHFSTFFELTNILMHISALYYQGNPDDMPVEIYRKELSDVNTNAVTTTAFDVDDATKNIKFFVYLYDRNEPNIETGMSLTSPKQMTFNAVDQLRDEFHQWMIVGDLIGTGTWSYKIKRFAGSPQPHYVQVMALPKANGVNFIRARSWIERPSNGGPHVIYAEVKQGNNIPILGASVTAIVTLPNNRRIDIELFDSGSGDPDVTKGDGIYSRRFTSSDLPGTYRFEVTVNDNGMTAYSGSTYPTQKCCGSSIRLEGTTIVPSFNRYLMPITVFITPEDIEREQALLSYIGQIGDLRVSTNIQRDSGKVTLEWTGPDVGTSNVNYEIKYSTKLSDIVDNFETLANRWQYDDPIPHLAGQVASVTLNLASESGLIGQHVYFAIRSFATTESNIGPISNYVRIFVPKKKPATHPPRAYDNTHDFEQWESEHFDPSEGDDGVLKNSNNIDLASLEYLIPIIIGAVLSILILCIYCYCCITRRRSYGNSEKAKAAKSPSKQNPTISVIVPPSSPSINNTYSSHPHEMMHNNQYDASVNGYCGDIPDHHTIGLPAIDDDVSKHDFLNYDKLLIEEEMKQQRNFQHHQQMLANDMSMMDAYGAQPNADYGQGISIISSNGTLSRNGRFLSPVESWTASQLLHEHERRVSPMDNDQSTLYGDNGEIVPPIPPHPYQNNQNYNTYSTMDPHMRSAPPPHYSTVYRPLVRSGPGQGSMQSVVSGAVGADKKIRNVTMV